MAFIVEMTGGEPDMPHHRFFCCGAATWNQALAVARQHGWQTHGHHARSELVAAGLCTRIERHVTA